jgi:hypothetical protein
MKEITQDQKPTHAKPSLYAYYFQSLKEIAKEFGYNLVLHGSLNRDLDLIAIPWVEELGDMDKMIHEFAEHLGGNVMIMSEAQKHCFPHGRVSYVINLNRGEFTDNDQQYYLDISVTPLPNKL